MAVLGPANAPAADCVSRSVFVIIMIDVKMLAGASKSIDELWGVIKNLRAEKIVSTPGRLKL